ncbi:SRPBCC family protein [Sphaerisporangium sp. NPDC051011]|uniref:SRPBCC family protein n=1 Tax=Sphaerisporangium sp. NPDC051011 TaxID=3155792 RepID=UPI0033CC1E9B
MPGKRGESHTIDTSITIRATPAQVWAILTDFGAYESWNPFILRARGEAVVGGTVALHIPIRGFSWRTSALLLGEA